MSEPATEHDYGQLDPAKPLHMFAVAFLYAQGQKRAMFSMPVLRFNDQPATEGVVRKEAVLRLSRNWQPDKFGPMREWKLLMVDITMVSITLSEEPK